MQFQRPPRSMIGVKNPNASEHQTNVFKAAASGGMNITTIILLVGMALILIVVIIVAVVYSYKNKKLKAMQAANK